jgi:hypothetical protein
VSLSPIEKPGSSSLLLNADGDFIGVEAAPTGNTDHRGINEGLDWTVRGYLALIKEHYANGVHNTLRVPRALLLGIYDGTAYTLSYISYVQDTSGVVTMGLAAGALVPTSDLG